MTFVQVNKESRSAKGCPVGYWIRDNNCWEWSAATDRDGYGLWHFDGRIVRAHRRMFEIYKGPIPDGLHIDHLCRNPSCVNPDHLEAVTPRVNTLRGDTPAARNLAKTHCRYGHEYTSENTRRYPVRGRYCRTCERLRTIRRRILRQERRKGGM